MTEAGFEHRQFGYRVRALTHHSARIAEYLIFVGDHGFMVTPVSLLVIF